MVNRKREWGMMSRRLDFRTAELVEITLLTRAAFRHQAAERYSGLVGIPAHIADEVLSRPLHLIRRGGTGLTFRPDTDRRRRVRS